MIKRLKDKLASIIEEEEQKIILMDASGGSREPDLRVVGLFSEIVDEKIAEIIHAMLFMNEMNKAE